MERKAEYCLTQIFHYLVNGLAAIVFFCCIAYSGYALWDNWSILKEPDQVREDLIRYKPANEEELSYSFQELKAMNPDVCGWLTLDHTKIDYPVVQGTDNFEYLEKDVLGNPSVAGSIFLDAKSDRNFHDFYTVIMGHHMQGRKMFGDIDLYTDVSFFEKNTTGTLYVEGRILKLETVAILKADAYDKYVYRADWKEKEEKILRDSGVSEDIIEAIRFYDRQAFNSDRRYYERAQETGTYLDELVEDTIQPEVKTVEDFLDSIENQHLYQVLIKVDRLTLQIALMKIQGYSTREIAVYLDITEKAVYRRMDRLKEKLKKFFE